MSWAYGEDQSDEFILLTLATIGYVVPVSFKKDYWLPQVFSQLVAVWNDHKMMNDTVWSYLSATYKNMCVSCVADYARKGKNYA